MTGFKLTNSGAFLLHAEAEIRFSLLTFGACGSQQVRVTDGGGSGDRQLLDRRRRRQPLERGGQRYRPRAGQDHYADRHAGVLDRVRQCRPQQHGAGERQHLLGLGDRRALFGDQQCGDFRGGAGATYLPGNAAGSTAAAGNILRPRWTSRLACGWRRQRRPSD